MPDLADVMYTPAPVANSEHAIELASGRYLDLASPQPESITLEDVAHHLAQTNRYVGACRRPYSVAEHAVLVSDRLLRTGAPPMVALAGLHHDDHEAFLGDTTRPLKQLLGSKVLADLERRLDHVIWLQLNLPNPGPAGWATIKAADDWALACEAHHLMPSQGTGWICDGLYDPSDPTPGHLGAEVGLSWSSAKAAFLARHHNLKRACMEAAA